MCRPRGKREVRSYRNVGSVPESLGGPKIYHCFLPVSLMGGEVKSWEREMPRNTRGKRSREEAVGRKLRKKNEEKDSASLGGSRTRGGQNVIELPWKTISEETVGNL